MKIAVVVMNLGGPSSTKEIFPFLFRLFNDRYIIGLPQPFRFLLACLIAFFRLKKARPIYDAMGGQSPILALTLEQSQAIQASLQKIYKNDEIQCFVAMRYAHPLFHETYQKVKQWKPNKVILLPLYPQYSTTTTSSAIEAWKKLSFGFKKPALTHVVCCYPATNFFVEAHCEMIQDGYTSMQAKGNKPVLVFSAHGIPESLVKKGDPYQSHVEQSVWHIVKALEEKMGPLEYRLAYQSKVGPMRWLGPSLDEVLENCGKDKKSVLVIPIAFVSEHSETLVELDQQYAELSVEWGIPAYGRVPALGTQKTFIQGLVETVHLFHQKTEQKKHITVQSADGKIYCSDMATACPCRKSR
jgi:ferrochelatase